MASTKIIFPYDKSAFLSTDQELLGQLQPYINVVKVGLEAMTAEDNAGRTVASRVRNFARRVDMDVMWDQKFDDIPNTVRNAVMNLRGRKIAMFTVHASAGKNTLEAAGLAASETPMTPLAVTILTSINEDECLSIFGDTPNAKVLEFARTAKACGIPGIVCSPKELQYLRNKGVDMVFVVPGIRPEWATWIKNDDQARAMTHIEAAELGANYLVIGRPISGASNPPEAARRIKEESAAV